MLRAFFGTSGHAAVPLGWQPLLEDEDALVDAIDRLDTATAQPTPNLEALAHHAWRADMPHAIDSLQRASQRLGQRPLPPPCTSLATLAGAGWSAGKPRSGLLAVLLGRVSAATYIQRFPEEQACWRQLVDGSYASPQAYAERHGHDLPAVREWLRLEMLTPTAAVRALLAVPEALLQLVSMGDLTVEAIFAVVREPAGRAAWVEKLLQSGLPLPAGMVANNPALVQRAGEALRAGTVSMDTFLSSVPRPKRPFMQALEQEGLADADAMLRAGALDAQAIADHVAAGRWTPAQAAQIGPLPQELANEWLRTNKLVREVYLRDSAKVWQPEDLLPTVHVTSCLQYASVSQLLQRHVLPNELAPRCAFALRLMATHVQGRGSLPGSAWTPDVGTCNVCLEELTSERPGQTLGGCAHPAAMCGDCLRQAIAHGVNDHCPYEDCTTPLNPENALQLGAARPRVMGIAAAIVRHALHDRTDWLACTRPDCCGGVDSNDVGRSAPCPLCQEIIRRDVDWQRDRSKISRLVTDLAAPRFLGHQPIRECYHCGAPTQINGGCMHMQCRNCRQHWDFNGGAANWRGTANLLEQSYVPRAGLLLTAGLYEGLVTSAHGPVAGVEAHVRARARALGLLVPEDAGNSHAIVVRRRR